MRLVQVIHSLRRGGAERILIELSHGLRKFGHDVHVVCLIDVNEYPDECHGNLFVTPLIQKSEYDWPRCIPVLAKRLKEKILEIQPDIVQIHMPNSSIVAAWAEFGIPCVQVFHGYGDLTRSFSINAWLRRRLDRWAFNRLGKCAVAVSDPMRMAIARHLGCSTEIIRCIPNGVDIHRFSFVDRVISDEPIIAMVGTLSEVKRTDQGIHAFSLLQKKIPKATLRIAGDGPMRQAIERLVTDLQLHSSVELLGSRPDVPDILAQSHVFWQLSRNEGLPLAVAEAMATGLPVVGSDVAGIRDIVVHENTGYLVPLDDPVAVADRTAQILSDPKLYKKLSLNGRAHVERKFNGDTMVRQHGDLLLRIASLKKSHRMAVG